MLFSSWLRNSKRSAPRRRRTQTSPRQRASFRPRPEALEDRCLLSGYQQTNLVGYKPGIAHFTDPNLNGWGMASLPDGSFVVANTFTTGLATFYSTLRPRAPADDHRPGVGIAGLDQALGIGPGGHPTGVVYNPTNDFVISENGKSAPARLIFDSIDGTISGWNPEVDPTHAILMVDNCAAGRRLHRAGNGPEQPGATCPVCDRFHPEPRRHVRWQFQSHRLIHRSERDEH